MHQQCPECAGAVQRGGRPPVAAPGRYNVPDGRSSITTCFRMPGGRSSPSACCWPSTMATAQWSCPGVATLCGARSLSIFTRDVEGHITTRVFRPEVPNSVQGAVFASVHGISYPGIRATKCLILSRFVWKRAASDITAWSHVCLPWERGKITKHMHVKPLHIPVPGHRFSHMHVDLVGPLPASEGCTYLFTIIDCTTPWAEAVSLATTSAADCACALFRGCIA